MLNRASETTLRNIKEKETMSCLRCRLHLRFLYGVDSVSDFLPCRFGFRCVLQCRFGFRFFCDVVSVSEVFAVSIGFGIFYGADAVCDFCGVDSVSLV